MQENHYLLGTHTSVSRGPAHGATLMVSDKPATENKTNDKNIGRTTPTLCKTMKA